MTENDLFSRVIAVADWGRVFANAFDGARRPSDETSSRPGLPVIRFPKTPPARIDYRDAGVLRARAT
jgi:hypothetical protein